MAALDRDYYLTYIWHITFVVLNGLYPISLSLVHPEISFEILESLYFGAVLVAITDFGTTYAASKLNSAKVEDIGSFNTLLTFRTLCTALLSIIVWNVFSLNFILLCSFVLLSLLINFAVLIQASSKSSNVYPATLTISATIRLATLAMPVFDTTIVIAGNALSLMLILILLSRIGWPKLFASASRTVSWLKEGSFGRGVLLPLALASATGAVLARFEFFVFSAMPLSPVQGAMMSVYLAIIFGFSTVFSAVVPLLIQRSINEIRQVLAVFLMGFILGILILITVPKNVLYIPHHVQLLFTSGSILSALSVVILAKALSTYYGILILKSHSAAVFWKADMWCLSLLLPLVYLAIVHIETTLSALIWMLVLVPILQLMFQWGAVSRNE